MITSIGTEDAWNAVRVSVRFRGMMSHVLSQNSALWQNSEGADQLYIYIF